MGVCYVAPHRSVMFCLSWLQRCAATSLAPPSPTFLAAQLGRTVTYILRARRFTAPLGAYAALPGPPSKLFTRALHLPPPRTPTGSSITPTCSPTRLLTFTALRRHVRHWRRSFKPLSSFHNFKRKMFFKNRNLLLSLR